MDLENKKCNKFVIMGLLVCVWFLNYFDRLSLNIAVLPMSKEFDLSAQQIGLVMSAFFASYAGMQVVGGMLADKFGWRKILTVCMILWCGCVASTGLAASFVSLLLVRFAFGFVEGSLPPAGAVMMFELFSREERGRAQSFLLSSTMLGAAFGTLIVASTMEIVGWRNIFFIMGGSATIFVALFWYYVWGNGTERQKPQELPKKVPLKKILEIDIVWKLVIIWFGGCVITWGLMAWMPSYWVNVKHLSLKSMGIAMFVPPLAGFFATNMAGWLLDKYFLGREKILIMIGAGVTAVSIYVLYITNSVAVGVAAMTVAMGLVGFIGASVFTMLLKHVPGEIIGSSTGLVNFGGQFAGVVSPAVMGYLIQRFNGSYDEALWYMIAMVGISFFVACTLDTQQHAQGAERPLAQAQE